MTSWQFVRYKVTWSTAPLLNMLTIDRGDALPLWRTWFEPMNAVLDMSRMPFDKGKQPLSIDEKAVVSAVNYFDSSNAPRHVDLSHLYWAMIGLKNEFVRTPGTRARFMGLLCEMISSAVADFTGRGEGTTFARPNTSVEAAQLIVSEFNVDEWDERAFQAHVSSRLRDLDIPSARRAHFVDLWRLKKYSEAVKLSPHGVVTCNVPSP